MKTNPISVCKDTKSSVIRKDPDSAIDINLFFQKSSLRIDGWDDTSDDGAVTVYASSTDTGADCPYCGHRSEKIHSRYVRYLQDLPAFGKRARVCFHARKFFCPNLECGYRTFAEQPGNEVFRYRRRTRRCEVAVHRHGLVMSSIQASVLLSGTGIGISKSTVLRDLHRMRIPERTDVRRIGIDDWAFRRGIDYGSIIIDLATGHPIDLLPGRTEADFSEWLSEHRSVWLLSRDRATSYSAAAGSCGFAITEIADRFHLIKNLGVCVTDTIASRYAEMTAALKEEQSAAGTSPGSMGYTERRFQEVKRLQSEGKSVPETVALLGMARKTVVKYRKLSEAPTGSARKKSYVNESRFHEVKRLQEDGKSAAETASLLRMSPGTVKKYRSVGSFPIPQRRSRSGWVAHTEYVEQQYARGVSLNEIYRNLAEKGAGIGRTKFYAHFQYLSDGHRGYRPAVVKAAMEEEWRNGIKYTTPAPGLFLPTVRELANTVMRSVLDKELSVQEARHIGMLGKLEWFDELHVAARSFRQDLRSGCPSRIDGWVRRYEKTSIPRLLTFVKGIKMDIMAVRNAALFRESNGIVEGFVNRLKEVKRTMYGKAKLHLLKVKIIMPPFVFN